MDGVISSGKPDRKIMKFWFWKWTLGSFVFAFCLIAFLAAFIPMWLGSEFNPYVPLIAGIITVVIMTILNFLTIHRHWENISFTLGEDQITIEIGWWWKRITNIQYSRIQNVVLHQGIFDRKYGLSTILIDTGGGSFKVMDLTEGSRLAYGGKPKATRRRGVDGPSEQIFYEGNIPGIVDPQPIVDFLLARAKGRKTAGVSFGSRSTPSLLKAEADEPLVVEPIIVSEENSVPCVKCQSMLRVQTSQRPVTIRCPECKSIIKLS